MFQWLQLLLIIFGCHYVVSQVVFTKCSTSACGNVSLDYPFWSFSPFDNEDTRICGYPGFGVDCTTEKPMINLENHRYVVRNIDYTGKSFTVVDSDFVGKTCPIPTRNSNLYGQFGLFYVSNYSREILQYYRNCSSYPDSVSHISCRSSNDSQPSSGFIISYQNGDTIPNLDWNKHCEDYFEILVSDTLINSNLSNKFGSILQAGFPLNWRVPDGCRPCEQSGGRCRYFTTDTFAWSNTTSCYCPDGVWRSSCQGVVAGVGLLLTIILLAFRRKVSLFFHVIYNCRNKTRSTRNVEKFLEHYGHIGLQRYMYSDLKKITNCFKDKLGQGGFGGVFKGKLKDGRFVAVKVLNEAKGNGEDFMNEVATIGRTNHVNVVSLIGFCSQGPKRALVYEYMPNGSLEKFIYNEKCTSATHPLGLEKLYQITLEIANGLEYLHRGCNNRILHFDIKPHNILLDADFCPKISDFGLAKLCMTRESIVSVLNARGTIGYIAPELCCRNFGAVSPKSDVYSYGMMVLEMVGGRKNLNATAENTSEIYFPHWIYKRLQQQGNIGSGELKEIFEEESKKKMIIIGLWCIQTLPANRPSMNMVVKMFEKSVQELPMPPNPFEEATSSADFQMQLSPLEGATSFQSQKGVADDAVK